MTPSDVIDFFGAFVSSHRRAVVFELFLVVCFFGLRRYITRRARTASLRNQRNH